MLLIKSTDTEPGFLAQMKAHTSVVGEVFRVDYGIAIPNASIKPLNCPLRLVVTKHSRYTLLLDGASGF